MNESHASSGEALHAWCREKGLYAHQLQGAAELLRDICARMRIPEGQLTVHSDNGSPMKGETMLATMQRLGVPPSRSRPCVSNDTPYAESLFHTLKYRPEMPLKPFQNLLHTRRWVNSLVNWYNLEHRHSAIRFVTPAQRHTGINQQMLQNRSALYAAARQTNPNRWSGTTRNWTPIHEVHLNPNTSQKNDQHPILKVT